MKIEPNIVTREIVEMVDEYAQSEIADAAKYANSEPLDESGIFSLHRLAARIYAHGFHDGETAAQTRALGERARFRESIQRIEAGGDG